MSLSLQIIRRLTGDLLSLDYAQEEVIYNFFFFFFSNYRLQLQTIKLPEVFFRPNLELARPRWPISLWTHSLNGMGK